MRGYLGLGSNVGDRLEHLRAARDRLPAAGASAGGELRVAAASSVYETEPQGEVTGQRDFLNACLRVETSLDPESLLDACKAVERDLGREPGGARHGARAIDVDLLLLGDVEYRSERLTVPHPRLVSRRFVLAPLVELDPQLALPDGTPLGEALSAVEGQRVARLGPL
ncbi:MAG: 2-amino-4-hydroxy-6-hydroxymethyldihydropteridine diphosphokinase [Actinomycetota bacterium]|nr:2-amino-4-hydroxy-6-hydroxymethyldihydropteridine diphosphokinase [Actinomycetota bacterium]